MLWTTLLVALLISAGAVAIVLWPLLSRKIPDMPVEDDRLTELLSRKDGVLTAIKDLEFDHQVGKLSDEDFPRFNFRLRQQAIGYLQQIDKLAPQSAELDESQEAKIARLRKTSPPAQALNGSGSSRPLPTTASRAAAPEPVAQSPAQSPARFCTGCGQALAPQHKFCANCGTAAG